MSHHYPLSIKDLCSRYRETTPSERENNIILLPEDDISRHIEPFAGIWLPIDTKDWQEAERYATTVYHELFETYKKRVKLKKETKESYGFSRNAGKILWDIALAIVTGVWKVKGYFPFQVHHPERIINAPMYEDRIVEQWLIEKYFVPVLTPVIYSDNFACQKFKGPDLAREEVARWLKEMYEKYGVAFYIYQFDCRKYFDNISHDAALEMFRQYGVCDFALCIYKTILDSYHETADMEECYAARDNEKGKYGMPKGNLPSQWTGVMYLNLLDHALAKSGICEHNGIYMDDGICICKDRAHARKAQHFVENFITQCHLAIRLNEKKTNIYPMSRGITFCGWHYRFDEKGELYVNEKKSKFREQEKKLDKTWAAYRKGHITPKKAMQKRNGIIAYTSKETDSDRIAHLFLKKYQLFEGEYDKYYKGKHNPLGLKNVKKADVQKKISAYAEKEKLIKSYCDDMIVFEEIDRGENAERILEESENCFSGYPTAT